LKIRLAAIAKDEAAYLPRWIYHHLRFGFDEIDIYVNNTTDNSVAVLDKISSQFPVRVIAADFIYERRRSISFQREAYSIILQDAIKQDVTHLLFLDIDEFWTPRDLVTSIHQCLEDTGYPDVISFAWANKVDEDVTFAGPYSQHTRSIENVHVKSLFRTSLKIRKLEVHNVISDNATYLLGDGRENLRKGKSTIDPQELGIEGPKRFFILHRMWRSQIEYISRLGQGKNLDRNGKAVSTFDLKRNRKGFMVPFLDAPESTFEIQEEVLDEYETGYREFLSTCDLEASMEEAQEFIIDRAKMVWRELPAARANNPRLVEKLLSNVAIAK